MKGTFQRFEVKFRKPAFKTCSIRTVWTHIVIQHNAIEKPSHILFQPLDRLVERDDILIEVNCTRKSGHADKLDYLVSKEACLWDPLDGSMMRRSSRKPFGS